MKTVELIKNDLLKARKEKNKELTGMLQLLISTVQAQEIADKREATDEEVVAIVKKDIVKYQEVLELSGDAPVKDKVDVLSTYIPKQLNKEEIVSLLEEKGAKKGMKIGQLMGMVMSTHKQFVDGNLVRETIQENFL